ncbi:MAG: acryloyl-CoA reductase [Gammaproteobacteria bacterium]|nr:acryloyl-CoA reductase [Gammaproteobacteria bacterium]MCP5137939.1 acryloyl-CoA reductase [Gammaproteobacteria bacterium]
MNEFRALRVEQDADGQIGAHIRHLKPDQLPAGEVLIRVSHSSVNYKDALAATGTGRIMHKLPMTGGIDLAGIVLESDNPTVIPGSAVLVTGQGLGERHDGGYAELARVPADWALPLPANLDAHAVMALGTAGFTAGLSLLRMEQMGQTPEHGPIAVTGATGGVGSASIALFAAAGYEVHAITGKTDEGPRLRELGAQEILLRSEIDFGRRPLESAIWGGAVDSAGGELLTWLTRTTKPWGNIAACGLVGGTDLHTTVMPFILRGVNLLGIATPDCPRTLREQVWARLAACFDDRRLALITAGDVTLDQLPTVFRQLIDGQARGRYVVVL